MTLHYFKRGEGRSIWAFGDSIFHTVGKICTMEMFYAALTNSHLKT